MRRSFVVVPLVLFVLFNACVPEPPPPGSFSNAQWTSIVQTQTASMWTASVVPTSTNNVISKYISNLLNAVPNDPFSKELERLEETLGASYEVLDVDFPGKDNGWTVFQINVRCTCASRIQLQCCSTERMFVLTLQKMYPHRNDIIRVMPATVREMEVKCFNTNMTDSFGSVSANWEDVKNFLYGNIDGGQFGFRVLR